VSKVRDFESNLLNMITDIDWKAFEKDCRDIVNEIADKFWDLGLDDGNRSDYGQDLIQK
jgi:hypothetical protein